MASNLINFIKQWGGSLSELIGLFLTILFCLFMLLVLWKKWLKPTLTDRGYISPALKGAEIGAPLVILIAVSAVLFTGLAAPQVMIGDEVTHYYMLIKQSENLTQPNFYADIPLASGDVEVRRYPHPFVWHYIGAVIYRLTSGSFFAVQMYQAFFLFQLLYVAFLLARSRGGLQRRSALLYVVVLASLPLSLVFSVAFYLDVPMAAQVLTAYYLLTRRKWFISSLFLALGIGVKITAILFIPAYFVIFLSLAIQRHGLSKGLLLCCTAALLIAGPMWGLGKAINIHGHSAFYPQEKLEKIVTQIKNKFFPHLELPRPFTANKNVTPSNGSKQILTSSSESSPMVIANHPGDLRIKANFLIYGGGVLWLVLAGGVLAACKPGRKNIQNEDVASDAGMIFFGGSYLLFVAYFAGTAPDARFFFPGIPFILLPLTERLSFFQKKNYVLIFITTLALIQGVLVIKKTYALRQISPALREGIFFLEENPPIPDRIFMYPEGNYRLFPYEHEWYLGYQLREFWHGTNEKRLDLLCRYGVGAVVVKKDLISTVDDEITNLGVYPDYFVAEISDDSRFFNTFENSDIIIFSINCSQKE